MMKILINILMKLRNDQKWCEISKSKTHGSSKKRKLDEGAQSSTFHASEASNADAERLPGVKAAKANDKKVKAEENALSYFERMWSIKQEDLARKERLSKMKLLYSLIGKQEPLAECEEALKKKLVTDLYKKSDRVEHCEGNKKRLKLVLLCVWKLVM
ncbi:hypothetical protein F2Q69_00025269 [Brassica cretica]|uniref:Uncharacterized protein n=1 Tax=Brassica cretica TaxID=69181 RepID=A0A8S9QL78_BRACR|nr:hypothetical protein F2Q69_00025269 [Brassica cretica]